MTNSFRKYSFYLYVAILIHLLAFIIILPDTKQNVSQMLGRLFDNRTILQTPPVQSIIVESYQNTNEQSKRPTPFVSEHHNPQRGQITEERGYNVTQEMIPTPSPQKEDIKKPEKQRQKPLPDENNADIILRSYSFRDNMPKLNLPRLKTKDHDRFILNFNEQGIATLDTRAFPNVKYFIDIAKTSWQYLLQFAPTNSVAIGAMNNSAVLIAFTMNREGQIIEVWVQDSTNSQTLNSLSTRAIEFVKNNVGGFGPQPPNYDIQVVYVYFYIGRDYSFYGDENRPVPVNMKGQFYFEYISLDKKNK